MIYTRIFLCPFRNSWQDEIEVRTSKLMSFLFLCPEEGCQQSGIQWGEDGGSQNIRMAVLGQAKIH